MRFEMEKIAPEEEEAVLVRCRDPEAAWVAGVRAAAQGGRTVCGIRDGGLHRLKLAEICYFEVVDDRSYI